MEIAKGRNSQKKMESEIPEFMQKHYVKKKLQSSQQNSMQRIQTVIYNIQFMSKISR